MIFVNIFLGFLGFILVLRYFIIRIFSNVVVIEIPGADNMNFYILLESLYFLFTKSFFLSFFSILFFERIYYVFFFLSFLIIPTIVRVFLFLIKDFCNKHINLIIL